jgi:hypothetical protein
MMHSSVIGLTLSIASGPEFASLLIAVGFHQLFEGLSLGIRIASLPAPPSNDTKNSDRGRFGVLGPTLAMLFAITVPAGIGIGLLAFGNGTMGREYCRLSLHGLMLDAEDLHSPHGTRAGCPLRHFGRHAHLRRVRRDARG